MANSKGKKAPDDPGSHRGKNGGYKKSRYDSDSDDDDRRGMSALSPNSKLRHNMGVAVDNMLSKLSSLRQSANHNKPAELFRKDLISAMKLPDSEILNPEEYYELRDAWRQDWEKGVQVPVNPDTMHKATVVKLENPPSVSSMYEFKLPKKLMHANEDDSYEQGQHALTGMQQLADQVVRYDLDDQDVAWVQRINQDRCIMGDPEIHEWTMERVMEALETECHENMSETMKNSEGLGIEYDEDVICDVCRSPDSEETNEMVFCDKCDLCLHQACYGIQTIPEGNWLCRTCALGLQPPCILCPNRGGAMKSTKSGTKWCHVSCALWIPEVSIGCVEKMEPITKISQVPASRWELICCICKERQGACIQCSVKSCKTAFHVTCAFNNGLEMNTILGDEHEEVKLKGYCPKHSKTPKDSSGNPVSLPCSPRKQYTEEEKQNLRQKRIRQIEEEFYLCVKVSAISEKLRIDEDVVQSVYEYWKLKRRVNFNRPLLMAKTEEADLLSKQQEDSLVARMKMFVHLRQDLERVRNLCYMVSRREKTRRSLYKMKELIFNKQLDLVTGDSDSIIPMSSREVQRIVQMNHHEDIYDKPSHILSTSVRFSDSPPEVEPAPVQQSPSKPVKEEEKSPRTSASPRQEGSPRSKLKMSPINGLGLLGSSGTRSSEKKVIDVLRESELEFTRTLASRQLSMEEIAEPTVDKTDKPADDYKKPDSIISTKRVTGLKRVTSLPSKSKSLHKRHSRTPQKSDNESGQESRTKDRERSRSKERSRSRSQERRVLRDSKRLSPEVEIIRIDEDSSKRSASKNSVLLKPPRENAVKSKSSPVLSSPRRVTRLKLSPPDISDSGAPSDSDCLVSSIIKPCSVSMKAASRNLLDSFKRVERNVAKSKAKDETVEDTPPLISVDEPPRVAPLRVTIPKNLPIVDSDTTVESDDSGSVNSTENRLANGHSRHHSSGYRSRHRRRHHRRHHSSPGSDHRHRHRDRSHERHSKRLGGKSPPKSLTAPKSPVKCTLISPGKLKLTLGDAVHKNESPIRKNDVCESFVRDRNTSPYKNHKESNNNCLDRGLSPTKSKSTVSVADMLKLRRRDNNTRSRSSVTLSENKNDKKLHERTRSAAQAHDSDSSENTIMSGPMPSKQRRIDRRSLPECRTVLKNCIESDDSDTSLASSRRSNSSAKFSDMRTRFLRRVNQNSW